MTSKNCDHSVDGMWSPSGGRTRDEWFECRAIDCDAQARTRGNILRIYKVLNYMFKMPKDQGSIDLVSISSNGLPEKNTGRTS